MSSSPFRHLLARGIAKRDTKEDQSQSQDAPVVNKSTSEQELGGKIIQERGVLASFAMTPLKSKRQSQNSVFTPSSSFFAGVHGKVEAQSSIADAEKVLRVARDITHDLSSKHRIRGAIESETDITVMTRQKGLEFDGVAQKAIHIDNYGSETSSEPYGKNWDGQHLEARNPFVPAPQEKGDHPKVVQMARQANDMLSRHCNHGDLEKESDKTVNTTSRLKQLEFDSGAQKVAHFDRFSLGSVNRERDIGIIDRHRQDSYEETADFKLLLLRRDTEFYSLKQNYELQYQETIILKQKLIETIRENDRLTEESAQKDKEIRKLSQSFTTAEKNFHLKLEEFSEFSLKEKTYTEAMQSELRRNRDENSRYKEQVESLASFLEIEREKCKTLGQSIY
jgi:hypothetical protein